MKIALAIKSLTLARGGAERFTRNLVCGLAARGHALTVLAHDWDHGAQQLGVELVPIPLPRPYRHPWFEFSRNVHAALETLPPQDLLFGLTQLCPQDVHRLGGGIYQYWYRRKYGALFRLQKLRARVRHCLEFERALYSPANYRRLITISNMDRRILMETYGVPAEHVTTVYNGFDFEEFHPRGRAAARDKLCHAHTIDPAQRLVLFASNNYVRKGLPQTVEALRRTRYPHAFTLVVIGKSRNSVRRRLQQRLAGVTPSVWLDHVPNPADYYRACDCMVFPTLYDSFANVIGEALACGLPVITTRQAGGAEMIVENGNGYVVSAADSIDELTACIELMSFKERCDEFSARAPELISNCTIERCAAETEKVLQAASACQPNLSDRSDRSD
jgi:UDP-glucose:(heptosyl)LPS alpha-1,3-glucosyltransferase